MKDYSKGKIYTIRCRTDDTQIYVGSTIQPLCERFASHKRSSKLKSCKNRLIYTTINNNWDNWYIELYELYPCNCKEELCRKEGEVIRFIGNLNNEIAGRTQKEYYEDNKKNIVKIVKTYRENNKDKIAEKKQIYYEERKEAIKEKRKKYYEENKEKILKKDKKKYEENKEKILKSTKERYERNKQEKQVK